MLTCVGETIFWSRTNQIDDLVVNKEKKLMWLSLMVSQVV